MAVEGFILRWLHAVTCTQTRSRNDVQNLTQKWHIYLTADGRISMAGLNARKCKYLAEAMLDSVTNF